MVLLPQRFAPTGAQDALAFQEENGWSYNGGWNNNIGSYENNSDGWWDTNGGVGSSSSGWQWGSGGYGYCGFDCHPQPTSNCDRVSYNKFCYAGHEHFRCGYDRFGHFHEWWY
jgi:hypothetical protein